MPPGAAGGGRPGAVPSGDPQYPQYGPSPFPELDAFIECVASQGGVQGRIRSWLYAPPYIPAPAAYGSGQPHAPPPQALAALSSPGPRDCGAPPRSPGSIAIPRSPGGVVMQHAAGGAPAGHGGTVQYTIAHNRWCANVGRAHKSNGIYFVVDLRRGVWSQRCYDPDCRRFRSDLAPVPPDVWTRCREIADTMAAPPPPTAASAARVNDGTSGTPVAATGAAAGSAAAATCTPGAAPAGSPAGTLPAASRHLLSVSPAQPAAHINAVMQAGAGFLAGHQPAADSGGFARTLDGRSSAFCCGRGGAVAAACYDPAVADDEENAAMLAALEAYEATHLQQ